MKNRSKIYKFTMSTQERRGREIEKFVKNHLFKLRVVL